MSKPAIYSAKTLNINYILNESQFKPANGNSRDRYICKLYNIENVQSI